MVGDLEGGRSDAGEVGLLVLGDIYGGIEAAGGAFLLVEDLYLGVVLEGDNLLDYQIDGDVDGEG